MTGKTGKMMRTLACAVVLGSFLFPSEVLPETVMKTIKEAVLRDSPSYLGKPVETLGSGTPITFVSEEGAWVRIKTGGKQGWLPTSALRATAVSLGVGSRTAATNVAPSQVALGGKGFSQEVEAAYRATRSGANYATVDMMMGFAVSPDDCVQFLQAGRAGGAR